MSKNTRLYFEQLIQQRNEHPEKKDEIDAEIHAIFCQTHAIAVMDMSGFSRTTLRYGIIHFLAMIHRMRAISKPVILDYGGTVVKYDADNIFAVFPSVSTALEAAIEIQNRADAVNTSLPDSMDIHLCVGIGYGEVIMLAGEDMFGSEFNLAAKLGEDLAERGEILLTKLAFEQLQGKPEEWEKLDFSISGLELVAYKSLRSH